MKKIIRLIILFGLFFTIYACEPAKTVKEVKPWVGKWICFEYTDSADTTHPWIGMYHYYENGTFSSQALSPDRTILTSNPNTLDEYKALFNMYRAGYGIYSVDEAEGILTYEYTANLRTHRINQPTSVHLAVEGDRMSLNYKEMGIVLQLRRESKIEE